MADQIQVNSNTSSSDEMFDDSSTSNLFITSEMIEEENMLHDKNERKEEKLRREYEKQLHEKEMKELRYKRLMHLLEKSQFYANFMHDKISVFLDEKNKTKNKKGQKRKVPSYEEDYSEEIISVCKKTKGNNEIEERMPLQNLDNTQELIVSHKKDTNVSEEKQFHDESKQTEGTRVSGFGIRVSERQPQLLEGAALRDYQLDGLDWLKLLFETGMNGILADEMGLGKTVQVIALICHLYEQRVPGPFLIVGPLSTLPNWSLEFSRFAPQLPVVLYHGSGNDRIPLRDKIIQKTLVKGKKVFPVVLTSYEVPIRDERYLRPIQWKYVIVDEGHRLKNYNTHLARTLKSFKTVNRLLLTGTPLQNNLIELWSLLHFLLPDIFDSLDVFQSWFEVEDIERNDVVAQLIEQEKKDHVLTVLHKILSPFLLRRVKSEVNLHLPTKKEVLVYCPLTKVQRVLYESTLDRTILKLADKQEEKDLIIPDNPDGTKVKRRSRMRAETYDKNDVQQDDNLLLVDTGFEQYSFTIKLLNVSMMLRKIVNHPYLVQMPVLPGSNILRVDDGLISSSGKMIILDGLLQRLKQRGHKVLLFSTFTRLLDLVEEFLSTRDYVFERLDGTSSLDSRKKSIHSFNTDPEVFIFLISTRAGGLGINLTAADTVIIYDSDWNPQIDLQAQDRCHRIGQQKPVIVYRFVTSGSIDEKIVSRAGAKRKLEKIIIQGGHFSHSKTTKKNEAVDFEELKELLNNKQHSLEIHSDGSVLSEEQWEKLLNRDKFEDEKPL